MEAKRVDVETLTELYQVDEAGLLFVSPEILDWRPLTERKVRLVVDLEGELDCGVPTIPNNLIYIYFPFEDEGLPDLLKLHALGRLCADMVRNRRAVLIHCVMGFNRSPLMAGVTMTYLGLSGAEALTALRSKRTGALYNRVYADYLASLPPYPELPAPV